MIWLLSASQRSTLPQWPVVLLAHVVVIVVLFSCWQRNRRLARWAIVGCGVVAGAGAL